jgi:hypothetical protein
MSYARFSGQLSALDVCLDVDGFLEGLENVKES